MAPTALTRQIAARIVDYIRTEQAPPGTRLVERTLAEHLRVSRSPVRSALRLLEDEGVVGVAERGGYTVLRPVEELPTPAADDDTEELYLRIAADRLDGKLPDRVTENGLARDYGLTPGQLARILRRINAEGWIERLPGYGWEFQPMLTSLRSYEDSYRFRLAIEPTAILEPSFALDRKAVEAVRDQQQELVDGRIWTVSNAELFDLNSTFHETIMECSGNTFFIDGLRRVDRLRRLIEYRRSLARDRAIIRCREHVEIADLLLAGERREAADALRHHLGTVGAEKVTKNRPGG
ncbi:GntR family transcriptional regulator [Amycolatopsis sp. 3B14]|uniref:GntR family transcriptional regulator n=1 Tax=Amycolatopsis sp. 3B14 TaxID=3243600 RepID=UPI003D952ADB